MGRPDRVDRAAGALPRPAAPTDAPKFVDFGIGENRSERIDGGGETYREASREVTIFSGSANDAMRLLTRSLLWSTIDAAAAIAFGVLALE